MRLFWKMFSKEVHNSENGSTQNPDYKSISGGTEISNISESSKAEKDLMSEYDEPTMKSQIQRYERKRLFRHIWSAFRRFIRLDTHYMLSFFIFIFVGLAFVIEFIFYLGVKGLVSSIEKLCTPSKVKALRKTSLKASEWKEFKSVTKQLDIITGRESWKAHKESPNYDWRLLEKRISQLKLLRCKGDVVELIKVIHHSCDTQFFLTRAGVLEESLYSRTYIGTKTLITTFLDEVCKSLELLCTYASKHMTPGHPMMDELKQLTLQLRCQWGSTALVLSGGAILGWHHIGAIEVLLKEDLLPQIICGTSAGAAIAAWVCTRDNNQLLEELNAEYLSQNMSCMEPASHLSKLRNFFNKGFCCDVDLWQQRALRFIGKLSFLEAFEKTGRILNVSLTRADREEPSIILSYKTAPNVLISSAVIASCSFPGLGPPFHLQEKSADGSIIDSTHFEAQYFHDGSIIGDVPLVQLKEIWGIQYAIVSQVNPHVFPFCGVRTHGEAGVPVAWKGLAGGRWRGGFLLSGLEVVLKEHMRFLLRLIQQLDVSPNYKGVKIGNLIQDYCGDVTIHPRRIFFNHRNLMTDPSCEEAEWYIQEGRVMTFTKLSVIKNRIRVDRKIDKLCALTLFGSQTDDPFYKSMSQACFERSNSVNNIQRLERLERYRLTTRSA